MVNTEQAGEMWHTTHFWTVVSVPQSVEVVELKSKLDESQSEAQALKDQVISLQVCLLCEVCVLCMCMYIHTYLSVV